MVPQSGRCFQGFPCAVRRTLESLIIQNPTYPAHVRTHRSHRRDCTRRHAPTRPTDWRNHADFADKLCRCRSVHGHWPRRDTFVLGGGLSCRPASRTAIRTNRETGRPGSAAAGNRPITHRERIRERFVSRSAAAAAAASGDTRRESGHQRVGTGERDGALRLSLRRRQPRGDAADLGRYASNPELSFTWYDAAVLSQKIRQDSHKFVSASRFEVPLPTDMDEYC